MGAPPTTRLLQKQEAEKPVSRHQRRVEELRHMPARERIAAIDTDLKAFPKEVSDENVFHYKTLLRMWEEMAGAKLVFRPRLRA